MTSDLALVQSGANLDNGTQGEQYYEAINSAYCGYVLPLLQVSPSLLIVD